MNLLLSKASWRGVATLMIILGVSVFVGIGGPAAPQALPVVSVGAVVDAQISTVQEPCDPTGAIQTTGEQAGSITLTRDTTSGPLEVSYSVSGSAIAGTGYVALGSTATFADGAATTALPIDPLPGADPGPSTVTVTLSDGATYTVGTPGTGTATIQHDGRFGDVVILPGQVPAGDYSCDPSPSAAAPITTEVLARTG